MTVDVWSADWERAEGIYRASMIFACLLHYYIYSVVSALNGKLFNLSMNLAHEFITFLEGNWGIFCIDNFKRRHLTWINSKAKRAFSYSPQKGSGRHSRRSWTGQWVHLVMIVETHLQIETREKTFTFRNEFSLKMKSRRQLANFEFCKLIRSVSKMLQKKLVPKGRNSRKSHLHFNIYIFLAVSAKQLLQKKKHVKHAQIYKLVHCS